MTIGQFGWEKIDLIKDFEHLVEMLLAILLLIVGQICEQLSLQDRKATTDRGF